MILNQNQNSSARASFFTAHIISFDVQLYFPQSIQSYCVRRLQMVKIKACFCSDGCPVLEKTQKCRETIGFSTHLRTIGLFHRDCLFVERRTRDRKVASSNPGRRGGRMFFSRVTLCAEPSSHATHQRTFGHSRLSSLSHCGPILW